MLTTNEQIPLMIDIRKVYESSALEHCNNEMQRAIWINLGGTMPSHTASERKKKVKVKKPTK